MGKILEVLLKCIIFNNLEDEEVREILSEINYRIKDYKKESVIGIEGDECNSIGIIIEGNVEIQKIFPSGKILTLTQLKQGKIFGEVVVFTKTHTYPATIISKSFSKIMFINKEDIINLCMKNSIVLENFMSLLSNKILMLNRKVKELSFESIRQKICNYLLELYNRQKSLTLRIPMNRKNLAEYMGVQRPSLSRELMKMRNDKLIDFDKDIIKIKNLQKIEDYLM